MRRTELCSTVFKDFGNRNSTSLCLTLYWISSTLWKHWDASLNPLVTPLHFLFSTKEMSLVLKCACLVALDINNILYSRVRNLNFTNPFVWIYSVNWQCCESALNALCAHEHRLYFAHIAAKIPDNPSLMRIFLLDLIFYLSNFFYQYILSNLRFSYYYIFFIISFIHRWLRWLYP